MSDLNQLPDTTKANVLTMLNAALKGIPITDWLPMLSFNILVRTKAVKHIHYKFRFGTIVYTNEHKPMLTYGCEPMLFPADHTMENIKTFYRQQGMTPKELLQFNQYELVLIHLEVNNTEP